MNKIKLGQFFQRALSVTGDVPLAGADFTMADLVESYDFNSTLLSAWILETNALGELVFSHNVLPFVVLRRDAERLLVVSDIDAKVNFKPVPVSLALMLAIHAAERLFGAKAQQMNPPLNVEKFNFWFQAYIKQFPVKGVVSPIERTEAMVGELMIELTSSLQQALSTSIDLAGEQTTSTTQNDLAAGNTTELLDTWAYEDGMLSNFDDTSVEDEDRAFNELTVEDVSQNQKHHQFDSPGRVTTEPNSGNALDPFGFKP